MLALSPLRSCCKDEMQQQNELEICFHNGCGLGGGCGGGGEEFLDFSGGNLLDSIDFDDLFVGISDEDVLPDLEMDPELLAEFSVSGGEESQMTTTTTTNSVSMEKYLEENNSRSSEEYVVDKGNITSSDFSWDSSMICMQGGDQQDVMSKGDESVLAVNLCGKQGENRRKSNSKSSKKAHGKRKMKVDWTPELHKRFVQAVEQLGVDKAVPSRILELMGIDCLTRHNIASHLQKYRSHRKNVLAREAEATNWSQGQKRQLYCAPAGGKRVMNPWHAPTIGFPPPIATPPPMHPHFRPLHVWGHPSVNQSSMHLWPKHLGPPAAPSLQQPTWGAALNPQPPLTTSLDPSFWHSHHHLPVPNPHSPGTPCFPPHLAPVRFPALSVPGIPQPSMCKIEPGIGVPTAPAGQPLPKPPLDFQPSKESIDAAIGDVLLKPWLPLPLGLKPPCVDGVLVELQRQGIPKIPPSTTV